MGGPWDKKGSLRSPQDIRHCRASSDNEYLDNNRIPWGRHLPSASNQSPVYRMSALCIFLLLTLFLAEDQQAASSSLESLH